MANFVYKLSDLDLNKSYTYADYLMWKFTERVELIKGKIFTMSPAPNTNHLRISQALNRILDNFFYKNKCQLFYAPFDVVLSKTKDDKKIKTVVQPDLGVICDLSKIDETKCNGAPDLVIEILSPGNSKKEMKIKYELYEENGVKEYWVIDPEHESVSVFILTKNKFVPQKPLTTEDKMKSFIFTNLEFSVEEIFKDVHKFKIKKNNIDMSLDSKIPAGNISEKWTSFKSNCKLVNPSNKRSIDVIVVGTGLAGSSAAASLAEMGYNVKAFCFQDSPRRAHSIAAQGGINAAKNYQNDGDSTYRLFYDTIKGGDYRAREANVHRLAEVSASIIDQCVAQGVPFARDYGGLLDNRSFGGTQVQRTFYAAGQTGQQLLLGAYSALSRQIAKGTVTMYNRHEMLDIVVVDGKARGIIARNLMTGNVERHSAHAVLLCTGGYGNVFFLSTNAMGSNVTAAWKAYKKGAYFANPCYTQIHPTCIPVSGDHQSKLTLMSESLRNDGRIWVPKNIEDAQAIREGKLKPTEIKEEDRDYYLERRYPAFGNLVPRDIASRAAKERCDAGFGVNKTGEAVYLDYSAAIVRYGKTQAKLKNIENPSEEEIKKLGKAVVEEKYGNLFQMYEKIVDENPYETPMMIYPAVHYTMGGLWVDYHLMTSIPGCYALGEANFSDHGANRLGASALMQGLADGYFVIPYTIGEYLSSEIRTGHISEDLPEFMEAEKKVVDMLHQFVNNKGTHSVDYYHKKLGKIMWNKCGMARNEAGLKQAISEIQALRKEFWADVKVPGKVNELNPELEKAGRVADFIELGELMCRDALMRNESCGGHFREEYQDAEGETLRDDENFKFVGAWQFNGVEADPSLHKEELVYENIKIASRNYK